MVSNNGVKYNSLYDFLGKPAGKELGKEVHTIAKYLGEEVVMKEVNNSNYNGKVCCYNLMFLNYIFTLPRIQNKL